MKSYYKVKMKVLRVGCLVQVSGKKADGEIRVTECCMPQVSAENVLRQSERTLNTFRP